MTDEQIIKALECCRDFGDCSLCPYDGANFEDEPDCAEKMHTDTLDLVNRQRAEIEIQQSEIKILKDSNINLQELYQNEKEKVAKAKQKVIDIGRALKTAKAEAIKEFAERLKKEVLFDSGWGVMQPDVIDNLVKEMTEGTE